MNSLPLPLLNFTLRKQTAFNSLNLTRFSNNYLATAESSVIKLSRQDNGDSQSQSQSQSVEASTINSMVYSRRDAIGLGLIFSLFDFSVLPRNVAAAADDAATCDFTSTPSGLAYCDTVLGAGASPVKGQLIKAHYVGKLENGKVFDSSYSRGKPLSFRVGVGEVIKGWDQGILGGEGVPPMLSGGKRILRIPPELGYGVRGAGCKGGTCIIPPNSVLLFDVEFIGKA